MDKEKEIEKMAHAIKTSQSAAGYYFPTKVALRMARGLSDAGYGDVRAAVKEFAEKLKDRNGNSYHVVTISYESIDKLIEEMCGDEVSKNDKA